MRQRTRRALDAVVAVAREHGVRVGAREILRDRSNLVIRLEPAPVVARVAMETATVRPGAEWLRREVAVAGFLADAGAPVVPPSALLPPGPHHRDGFDLSFWTLARQLPGLPDPTEAGRRLRDCHRVLAAFPGDLPRFGLLDEADRIVRDFALEGVLQADDFAVVRRLGIQVRADVEAAAGPAQAVHGDAHLGNVLHTADGPLWTDWEDTFLGPVEWDIACLTAFADADESSSAAAAAGGLDPHVDLTPFLRARRYQAAVWGVVLGRARGDEARIADAIGRLRAL